MMILNNVSILSARAGSGIQQMAWGELKVSEKTSDRNITGERPLWSTSFPCAVSIFSHKACARSRRIGEPSSHGRSSTRVLARKWLVCTMSPEVSSCRVTVPAGDTSRPRLPACDEMRICWLDAHPRRRSISARASDSEDCSRSRRRTTCTGSICASVKRTRMAFRHTPTEAELKPILPTMPG